MNTHISYMYRDASNYKQYNEAIVEGELSLEDQNTILGCLDEGEYFIPGQVGLPEKRFEKITEDDHCWFEMGSVFASPCSLEPTVNLTSTQLVANFVAAKDSWNDCVLF